MAERRWQPPPMQPKEDAEYAVDDRLLDRVLAVNPELNRDTLRIPRAQTAAAIALAKAESTAKAAPAPAQASGGDLATAINYFVATKDKDLRARLADFEQRQAKLTAERQASLQRVRDEFVTFLSLLDRSALERSGAAAFARHQAFLDALGVTAADVLAQLRRGK